MARQQRTQIGVLQRHAGQKYLKTKHGHLWDLEIDDDRILGLVGLTVQVKGVQRGNLIVVEGINQA